MTEPFIFCDGLVKIYKVAELEVVALQGLNLSVRSGELMGIVGASGSGKSTLMNILGGLDRPTAGRVRVGEHDLLKMSEAQLTRYRREQVGFVWQQSARNLVPYLNAVENVELPMTLAGVAGRAKRKHATELLELVGLGDRIHHRLTELSGGEQQRVAIAVALANNPTLLLADEPTGEVDSATALVIYGTFRRLTEELGLTTLIVSHDPGIARHVDRVVAIRDGMLASETRRQMRPAPNGAGLLTGEDEEVHHEEHFEELVVLDNAGRLQIPKDVLEQFAIRGRAVLDITDDGILIRPAPDDREAPELDAQDAAAARRVAETVSVSRVSRFFQRFRRRGES
ncbi:MAG: ATP-binding cassette domain-containing protein [Caldilineae bacterium]|nr:MAG: ATP-binding cassette domain-containing protein [Caldilineae bacterium]